jgi:hypothetical protein
VSRDRQIAVLAVLVGLFVITYLWQRGRGGQNRPVKRQSKAADIVASAAAFAAADVPLVLVVRPEPLPGETLDRGRINLFSYEQSPEEKAEVARQQAEAAEKARIAAEAAAKARAEQAERDRIAREEAEKRRREKEAWDLAHPPPPPPPVPPEFRYQFIGVIGPMDAPLAIITDGGEGWRYVKVGDVIDGKFRVEGVGRHALSLDLSYVDPKFANEILQVPRAFPSAAGAPGTTKPSTSPRKR